MKTTIDEKGYTVITAEYGYKLQRVHDGQLMGNDVVLGFDYSTGVKRIDLPEYYEEILVTEQELSIESKVNQLEQTTNDIINVMNERGLL